MVETLAVSLIFIAALLVLGARLYKSFQQASAPVAPGQCGGCGGGCACSADMQKESCE